MERTYIYNNKVLSHSRWVGYKNHKTSFNSVKNKNFKRKIIYKYNQQKMVHAHLFAHGQERDGKEISINVICYNCMYSILYSQINGI